MKYDELVYFMDSLKKYLSGESINLTEDSFRIFRRNLIFNEDSNVREKIPAWFIDVRNLCSLWDALKFLPTYSERRRHIDSEFSELLLYLEFKDAGILKEKIKEEKVSSNLSPIKKEEKIFISHSAKDKEYAEELVHLLLSFGMERNKILCTSVPGVQLEVGTPDFLIAIKDYLINSPLFICMFSQNYLDSPICLCEMGAAWITSKEQRLILTPETDYTLAANTIIGKNNGMKINERHRIAELIEQLQKMFNLPQKGMVESSELIERYIKKIKDLTERKIIVKENQKNSYENFGYQNETLEKVISKKNQENIVSEEIKTNKLIQLANDNCIGRFLLRADKKSFLNLLLELTSKEQKKVLNSLEDSYSQDTGFGGYENYAIIGRVMFDYIKKSKDKECNNIALNILEGCSRYKSELQELVKDAKIEIIFL